jgi:hypothetical protein
MNFFFMTIAPCAIQAGGRERQPLENTNHGFCAAMIKRGDRSSIALLRMTGREVTILP